MKITQWSRWAFICLLPFCAAGLADQDATIGWQNDCSSTKDWYDAKSDAGFGAKIESAEPSVFKVTQAGTDSWGKVAYVVKGVDVDKTPFLEVQVNKVDVNSAFKVCVSSLDWKDFYEVVQRTSADGAHVGSIKEATGWTGVKDFNVILIVEGKDKSVWFNNIKISSAKK